MRKFSANFAFEFDKATNGQTDIKHDVITTYLKIDWYFATATKLTISRSSNALHIC